MNYIIIQAGGKGTRLETLTRNKPKALVPIDNLPMIFHLFKKYPDAHFKIIADYQKDVLKRYLKAFTSEFSNSFCESLAFINSSIKLTPQQFPSKEDISIRKQKYQTKYNTSILNISAKNTLKLIFSITKSPDKTHKVITLIGVKLKLKSRKKAA